MGYKPRLALKIFSFCLMLQSAEIAGICCHAQLLTVQLPLVSPSSVLGVSPTATDLLETALMLTRQLHRAFKVHLTTGPRELMRMQLSILVSYYYSSSEMPCSAFSMQTVTDT